MDLPQIWIHLDLNPILIQSHFSTIQKQQFKAQSAFKKFILIIPLVSLLFCFIHSPYLPKVHQYHCLRIGGLHSKQLIYIVYFKIGVNIKTQEATKRNGYK